MSIVRVIPRIDIKGPNLVKGIHLEGLRVLGKPEQFAKYYYDNGADELFYQDVVASLYERNSLQDIITKTAKEIFIPLTIGGGLRTTEDIQTVLKAGADKISLNTAAIKEPEFIRRAAKKFGSSTIVVAIEAIKSSDGTYQAFIDNGREYTGVDVVEWAEKVESLGAGEIILTSVDQEGTGLGYDEDLTRLVSAAVNIPVIAHGGAGSAENIVSVVKDASADAVSAASIFHYSAIEKFESDTTNIQEGNTSFLQKKTQFKKITPYSIEQVKRSLIESGMECRL